MRRVRRDHTGFNLSFLDCICCGFGAILLLFVLSKRAEPIVIEQVTVDLSTLLERLEEELNEIRGEVDTFNRDLEGKVEQLSEENQKLNDNLVFADFNVTKERHDKLVRGIHCY